MRSPAFRYGRPIRILTQTVTGHDDYGNDTPTEVTTVVEGCSWWPTKSEEITEGRDQIVTGLTVLTPPGTKVTGTDRVIVQDITYQVEGDPMVWSINPFTGSSAGVELVLRRVTG